jgi:hypothetical protein
MPSSKQRSGDHHLFVLIVARQFVVSVARRWRSAQVAQRAGGVQRGI